MSGPRPIRAVISDFGGVLTSPLIGSFAAVQDQTGISLEQLSRAMQAEVEASGRHPLFELEVGAITERRFLEVLRDRLEPELGHRPELHRFKEIYFEALEPNQPAIEKMRELRRRGLRMALLTNNVREWEPLWRSMLPVDEIFEEIVDSAFVGMRKPDPEIYELTLERLGSVEPGECLFVDDLEPNVATARELGMAAVHFTDTAAALEQIEAALAGRPN